MPDTSLLLDSMQTIESGCAFKALDSRCTAYDVPAMQTSERLLKAALRQ